MKTINFALLIAGILFGTIMAHAEDGQLPKEGDPIINEIVITCDTPTVRGDSPKFTNIEVDIDGFFKQQERGETTHAVVEMGENLDTVMDEVITKTSDSPPTYKGPRITLKFNAAGTDLQASMKLKGETTTTKLSCGGFVHAR